ncbi:MAG: hypothetical protein EBZ47_07420 [Chlamydiae bacterium]|nr:hypothetical protein [Chlamydiota bacterium]
MKLVTLALREKGLKVSELSEALQERVASLKELTDNYNEAVEDYDNEEEKDEATEAELDQMEHFIAENDADIANAIKSFDPNASNEPAPEPTPAPAPEKKKDGGLGWLIFGGIALVVTLGAVNVLKKK